MADETVPAQVAAAIAALTAEQRDRYNFVNRKRAYQKGRLTKLATKLQTELLHPVEGNLLSIELTLGQIQTAFYEHQNLLEEEFEAIEALGNHRENFDDKLLELDCTVKEILSQIRRNQQLPSTSNNTGAIVPTMRRLRIADAQLPSFSGDRLTWPTFKKVFTSMISEQEDISSPTKLMHLQRSCMEGTAAHIVNSTVDSDFETAWSRLTDYYDNDCILKMDYVAKLYSLNAPKINDPKSLHDFILNIESNVSILNSMGIDTNSWALLLIHHLSTKLDLNTKQELEKFRPADELLTIDSFLKFLKSRIRVLEVQTTPVRFDPKNTSTPYPQSNKSKDKNNSSPAYKSKVYSAPAYQGKGKYCSICDTDTHGIFECEVIKPLDYHQRLNKVQELKLCFNCLSKSHAVKDCTSIRRCLTCTEKHHSILHKPDSPRKADSSKESSSTEEKESVSAAATSHTFASKKTVLLATAVILVENSQGNRIACRAFLDSGSSVNFMRTETAQLLNLNRCNAQTTVTSINNSEMLYRHQVTTVIHSRTTDYSTSIDLLLSRKIVGHLPSDKLDITNWNLPPIAELADPAFSNPAKIDILLGASVFYDIAITQQRQLDNGIWLNSSKLGIVVAGSFQSTNTAHAYAGIGELKSLLQSFWEVENVKSISNHTAEQRAAETHFVNNTHRRTDNHYEVGLPFNDNLLKLGETMSKAKAMFLSAEKRRLHDPIKNNAYREFMNEMIQLGHMFPATGFDDNDSTNCYFMTHHIIQRPSSTTTQFRVVFNASFRSTTGRSLNDCLLVGPPIQDEVFSHLLRWREFPVAVTSDICKMFRQIFVHNDNYKWQMIWWRDDPSQPLMPYYLCTVIYGTASAPFLAQRTLKQLAIDEAENFPNVAILFDKNFYMDDFVASFTNNEQAQQFKDELIRLALKGGFELRKWCSNYSALNDELTENELIVHVLGMNWNRESDDIILAFNHIKHHDETTRSTILSTIAQMFDPLGLLSPIVLYAKTLMQRLWLLSANSWDEPLPDQFTTEWLNFQQQLKSMEPITIPRAINISPATDYFLHGFCDASETGYGACVYLVSNDSVRLICSKSRVAPIKRMTTPRLELLAAVLLANLVTKVASALTKPPSRLFYWSDSEITLFRIRSQSSLYNVFVGSRIAEIQQLSISTDWLFVPTDHNPADIVSRGCLPNELHTIDLWWNGPIFLTNPETWPNQEKFNAASTLQQTDEEIRKQT